MSTIRRSTVGRVMRGPLDVLAWLGGGRVAVSVPAADAEDAVAVWEASEGVALPALVAHDFPTKRALVDEVARSLAEVPVVSVALGGRADATQWKKVLACGTATPLHLNQPFVTAAYVKGRSPGSWVNGLVELTDEPGRVRLAGEGAARLELEVGAAAALLAGGRVDALKLHPTDPEHGFRATVAAAVAAAEAGLAGFEPAGGLDLANTPRLIEQLVAISDTKILPHVFGAVTDVATGRADLARVRRLVADVRAAVG